MADTQWMTVCGAEDAELASKLESRVAERIARGEFSSEDIRYIEKLRLSALDGELQVNDATLEKLRRLCGLFDAELSVTKIESHRPVIGPLIVAVKKLMLPIMKVLLKEQIRKQRDFNAGVIRLLADLAHETQSGRSKPSAAPLDGAER